MSLEPMLDWSVVQLKFTVKSSKPINGKYYNKGSIQIRVYQYGCCLLSLSAVVSTCSNWRWRETTRLSRGFPTWPILPVARAAPKLSSFAGVLPCVCVCAACVTLHSTDGGHYVAKAREMCSSFGQLDRQTNQFVKPKLWTVAQTDEHT